MPLIQSVSLDKFTIDLHKFTGEVVDEKIWSTTHVAGGGGGYNVGSGQNNPVTIASTSVTHNQFFLKDETGQEKAVELADSSVPVRKGHRVTVIWGVVHGREQGSYVAVVNHSLNSRATFAGAIQSLANPGTPTPILLAWIVSFFAICFYGLGFIGLIYLTITRRKYKKNLLATLQSAVDSAVAQS